MTNTCHVLEKCWQTKAQQIFTGPSGQNIGRTNAQQILVAPSGQNVGRTNAMKLIFAL
jgi:hypothetical protein